MQYRVLLAQLQFLSQLQVQSLSLFLFSGFLSYIFLQFHFFHYPLSLSYNTVAFSAWFFFFHGFSALWDMWWQDSICQPTCKMPLLSRTEAGVCALCYKLVFKPSDTWGPGTETVAVLFGGNCGGFLRSFFTWLLEVSILQVKTLLCLWHRSSSWSLLNVVISCSNRKVLLHTSFSCLPFHCCIRGSHKL